MASKRHQRRKSCEGKKRYATEVEASAARFDGMHYYRCPFCGWWHIGHVPIKMKLRHVGEKP